MQLECPIPLHAQPLGPHALKQEFEGTHVTLFALLHQHLGNALHAGLVGACRHLGQFALDLGPQSPAFGPATGVGAGALEPLALRITCFHAARPPDREDSAARGWTA